MKKLRQTEITKKQRLTRAMEESGVRRIDLARMIGKDPSQITRYLNSETTMPYEDAKKIQSRYPDIKVWYWN